MFEPVRRGGPGGQADRRVRPDA